GCEGLGQIIDRAQLHRLDGRRYRSEGGDHDDFRPGVIGQDSFDVIQAIMNAQPYIQEYQVEDLSRELLDGLLDARGGANEMTLRLQTHSECDANVLLIIDNQNA